LRVKILDALWKVRPQADSYRGAWDGAAVGSSASGLLQRERGGHRAIRLPAVGARLRANAAGTERNSAVRPQGRF